MRPEAASFPDVSEPVFHFVCVPSALVGAPAEWAIEMLGDGEIALLADGGGFAAINEVAQHAGPGQRSPGPMRGDGGASAGDGDGDGGRLPLVWVGEDFSEKVTAWARARGPMTLLVEATGPLSEDERGRIDRFVASLGRQSE